MAMRARDWPGYTQWYCCPQCRRLWTFHDNGAVALEREAGLGPAHPSEGIPARTCSSCKRRTSYVMLKPQSVLRTS